jgi:hypothetical protein
MRARVDPCLRNASGCTVQLHGNGVFSEVDIQGSWRARVAYGQYPGKPVKPEAIEL